MTIVVEVVRVQYRILDLQTDLVPKDVYDSGVYSAKQTLLAMLTLSLLMIQISVNNVPEVYKSWNEMWSH